jgi:uncharacterized Zn finger protein (UPF0148 family)
VSAECSQCGTDLYYDLSCPRCETLKRAEAAEEEVAALEQKLAIEASRPVAAEAERDELWRLNQEAGLADFTRRLEIAESALEAALDVIDRALRETEPNAHKGTKTDPDTGCLWCQMRGVLVAHGRLGDTGRENG